MTTSTILKEHPSLLTESGFHSRIDLPSSRPSKRLGESVPAFIRAIARESHPDAAAAALCEKLVAELGAVMASVYFTDAEGQTLRLIASKNLPPTCVELAVVDIHGSSLIAARAACTRSLQVDNATSARARRPRGLGHATAGVTFALPLVVGEHLLGVMCTQFVAGLELADLEALECLGGVLGVVVHRTRLEEEARARDEWTRVVAHELRQPLQTIALHAISIAQARECRCVDAARRVIEGVSRVNRITGDLLDASDITTVALRRRPTDLERLARGLAAPSSDDRKPRVQVRARGEIPEINVDPARIEQILANLVGNAEKYGRSGSDIEVVLERDDDEIIISVTNAGDDLPEEERSRVFDRHYRAHRSMAVGWGIGLYVCRGLAEAHGGRISVESGGGTTTFSIVLPLSHY